MSQAPSMPVFPDALIGDTLHLSAEEFGAYCLILFATWRNNGQALADDAAELAHVCRVTPARWRGHMRPKLARFFDTSDGHWHQKRLEREWDGVQKKLEANRANGIKGGRPPKNPDVTQQKPAGSVSDNPEQTQPQSTHTQSHSRPEASASGSGAGVPANPPKERSNGTRKSRLSPDWEPDRQDCEYAAARGHDGGWISEQADKFRNRCLRDDPVYADWHAAWRTWVGNAEEFAASNARRANGGIGHSVEKSGGVTAAMRAVLSRGQVD